MNLPDFSSPIPRRRARPPVEHVPDPVRGTGRTRAMLRELPDGQSVVIVHTPGLTAYVLALVRHLNDEDGRARQPEVWAVERPEHLEKLRGRGWPLAVDHAFWDLARLDAQCAVRDFLAHRARAAEEKGFREHLAPTAPVPAPKVIEAADTMGLAPSIVDADTLALTVRWPDGVETRELVSERAAALLGYTRETEKGL